MTKRKPTEEEIWFAAHEAAAHLRELGVPYALIGGLAVSRYGFDRATRDVDFLVTEDGLAKLTGRPLAIGLTERVAGVQVDYLPVEPGEDHLEDALRNGRGNLPTIPLAALVYLKLKANRKKDQADVVELVKRGAVNVGAVRYYLSRLDDPDLTATFDLLVLEAEREAD